MRISQSKNESKGLFLSVYVDDFELAGRAENITPMWKQLGKKLDFDTPQPLDGGVYLDCGQHSIPIPVDLVLEKRELMRPFLTDAKHQTAEQSKDSVGGNSSLDP